MNTKEIIDQMAEVMLAGSETTAGTMANLFLELMRNPDVKAKLISSLPVLSPDDPIISSKTVRTEPQFEYLEACIKEVLRLHPIASEMGRRTGDFPINLMGYDLPPYTVVSVSYRYLHRNPEHWPEPLRFWPERWLENRPEDVPPPEYDFVLCPNAIDLYITDRSQYASLLSVLCRQTHMYWKEVSHLLSQILAVKTDQHLFLKWHSRLTIP